MDKSLTCADYKTAIVIQDACNLSGVVHAFSDILSRMCDAGLDTDARNRHPISIMFADKIASLSGVLAGGDIFSIAYDECKSQSESMEG